jgi:Membrane bound beta barrel domain (DUF5777)
MKTLLTILLTLAVSAAFGQDELLDILEKDNKPATTYTIASFKGTRIVNSHSVETLKKKHMDYVIGHRFGALSDRPFYNFLGMDLGANTRMAFEYGITDAFTVGLGRNSTQRTYDFYGKYRLLRQSQGLRTSPVTLTLFGSMASITEDSSPNMTYFNNAERQSYVGQAMIARKFGERLTLQLAPTFVHRNKVLAGDQNTTAALGTGGRFKLNKRLSLNGEYYLVGRESNVEIGDLKRRYNSFAIGFDIETGGHVFQLHVTNSRSMIERQFITETTGDFLTGKQSLHFGFNISRMFSLDRRAKGLHK